MRLKGWHIPVDKDASLKETKSRLLRSERFVSVIDESEKTFKKYIDPFNLPIPFPVDFHASSNLFARADGSALLHVRMTEEGTQSDQGKNAYIDVVAIAADEPACVQLLNDCMAALGAEKVVLGLRREAKRAETIRQLEDGPHGKFLSDPDSASSLEVLYNPQTRERVHLFAKTFGDSAILESLAEEALKNSGLERSEIRRLMNDDSLFLKSFTIGCDNCGASTLVFPTREEAKETLSRTTSHKCFVCEKPGLKVTEVFTLREDIVNGSSGLWLEHLIHQLTAPVSLISLPGKMWGNFELDVITVTWGNTILFECKDTSFGEKDFWMSEAKAQAVDADVLWLITTQPLHENVRRSIERHAKETSLKVFTTEGISDKEGIKDDIYRKLEPTQTNLIGDLLSEPMQYAKAVRYVMRH